MGPLWFPTTIKSMILVDYNFKSVFPIHWKNSKAVILTKTMAADWQHKDTSYEQT